jgi:O-antigen/teichoic acid export membrane protein
VAEPRYIQDPTRAYEADSRRCGSLLAPSGKFRGMLSQLTLFALRAGTIGSKSLLAIYIAHYLSLSDLGIYGLLAGGTTLVPALSGLGLTAWIARRIVDLPLAQALPIVASRSALSVLIHLVGQPLVLLVFILAGRPLPLALALLGGAILLLETLAAEISDFLIARRLIFLANWLAFLRHGFWPLPVMVLGLLVPQARSLSMLLSIWCAALVLTWMILLWLLLQKGRWRYVRLQGRPLLGALRGSFLLYVKDVSGSVSTFADRFLVSLFLGLELSGIYSLFWAIANVVHGLVMYCVVQTHTASLIGAAKERTGVEFRALERRLQIEAVSWALLFAGGVAALTPILVTAMDRPLMQDYLPVFWLILLATLLRIGADGYDFAIYAFHRDRAIAFIAIGGALLSAVLNIVLTPVAGLWGSALAYILTSAALLTVRFFVSRSAVRSVRSDP